MRTRRRPVGLLLAALLCAGAAPARSDDKPPPNALDQLKRGFGLKDSQETDGRGNGPSGGRAAAQYTAQASASRSLDSGGVPAPVSSKDNVGGSNTILGVDKKGVAGVAAVGGIALIALSGGSLLAIGAGAVLLIGGGGYLLTRAKSFGDKVSGTMSGALKTP